MSLLPDRLKTVKVAVPQEYSRNVYRFLSRSENLDIIDMQKKPLEISSFEHGTKIKEHSESFDKVVANFAIVDKVSKNKFIKIDDRELGVVLKETERISKEVIHSLKQIDDRITLAEQELEKNKSAIEIAQNLIPFGFSFEDLDDERPYFVIHVGQMDTKRVPRFKWNLDAITDGNYVLKESPAKGYSFIAIGFLERYQEDINRLLVAYGFEKSSVPERITGTPDKVVKRSKEKIVNLEKKISELKLEADDFISIHGAEILGYAEQLQIELNYLKIANMTRQSKKNVSFWAWVPVKKIKSIEKEIIFFTENTALIEFQQPVFEESEYPTKNSVPKFARNYDGLVNAYGTPGYNEFNTAILIQIFFPIMFGIMFADVGHGLLFALLGVYGLTLQNKKLKTDSFMGEIQGYFKGGAILMIVSGITAMIFGVLFGSYFGVTHEAAGYIPEPLWFSPEHGTHNGASAVILMLELSLLIGMIHMTIGYVLRFIKNIRQKHFLEAICVTLMWTIFHWSLFILVFTFGTNFMEWFDASNSGVFDLALLSINGEAIQFFTIPNAMLFFLLTFALPILVMTVFLLVHGYKHGSMLDGGAELIELLLSTLSNTVSYARIFAMNAVHGALSHIFTLQDFTGGHGMGVVNYIGVALGAVVILGLEGLFSFIQTLRLQWVEFFAKVGYQGTGFKFKSMAIARQYSNLP
ncbi:MAG: V-type ATP synthase subunit I [Candidatus Heimdallarchaeota archaeon]